VGWCVHTVQTTPLAIAMFAQAVAAHGVPRTVHADNGSIQRAGDLVKALTEQNVLTSYSRPRVSDDNPFSESLFKTIKYDPACPERFDSLAHAREWTAAFLHRYATEHRHSALGRHTPPRSTAAPPTRSSTSASACSTPTGPRTPNASGAGPPHQHYRNRQASTRTCCLRQVDNFRGPPARGATRRSW
jgi:hypothetical protein